MELLNLKCQNCGAKLKRNDSNDTMYCPHCGSSFAMTDFANNDRPAAKSVADQSRLSEKAKNGFTMLESSSFDDAAAFFKNLLLFEPDNAECYIGLMLAKLHCRYKEELLHVTDIVDLDECDELLNNTIKFGNDEQRAYIENVRLQQKYCLGIRLYGSDLQRDVEAAKKIFSELGNYKDSAIKVERCNKRIDDFKRHIKFPIYGVVTFLAIAAIVVLGIIFLLKK